MSQDRRSSRAELEKITNLYFDAIEQADGSIVPFARDGFRIENGTGACNSQEKSPWAIRPTSALIGELFKIEDHKIQGVMAVITNSPTGCRRGGRLLFIDPAPARSAKPVR